MTARDHLVKAAIDALYDARDSGKMMGEAAVCVLDAVLAQHENVMLELGFKPGPISGGRDHWVSRAHPYDPEVEALLAQHEGA